MELNNLPKINKKKIRVGRGIGSGKGKTSSRGHKVKNPDVAIKSFEGVKCRFIEGCQKEV